MGEQETEGGQTTGTGGEAQEGTGAGPETAEGEQGQGGGTTVDVGADRVEGDQVGEQNVNVAAPQPQEPGGGRPGEMVQDRTAEGERQ